ncbi:class I SAM-dependent methyltransferase [Candidatus Roizmanbacteria bacterium]|nr:class I SAM-dependent methyltransferase [Candidatus Roizmanbacteria bacterium]
MENQENDNVSSVIEKYPSIKSAVQTYEELWPNSIRQSELVRKYMMDELNQEKPLTANPDIPGNSEYETVSALERTDLLKQKLQGKVLDIGSGGVDELAGIVDVQQLINVDSREQLESNFIKVDVGKEELPFTDAHFDSIFTRNTIDSLAQATAILPEALRVLKTNGVLIVELQYLPEAERQTIIDILNVLEQKGIDIQIQVEAVLNKTYIQHKKYSDLRFNRPSIFLLISKKN